MKVKLYFIYEDKTIKIGEFKNYQAADKYYCETKKTIEKKYGKPIKVIYVC